MSAKPEDAVVMPPLADPAGFTEIMSGMARDRAPRVFAVVQELDERADARIAAWGMAFDSRAEVVSADGGFRMGLGRAEDALRAFSWGDRITAHLVWVDGGEASSEG